MVFLFIMIVMVTSFGFALRINEIMYNPSQGDNNYNEWIELFNDGDEIDLEGFSICGVPLLQGYIDLNLEIHDENGFILEEDGYVIITDGGTGTEVYDNFDVDSNALALHVDAASLCGRLTNSGKEITIEEDGSLIDSVDYADDAEQGYSLEFIDGDLVESEGEGGTPGEENSQSVGGDDDDDNENDNNENSGDDDDSDDDSNDDDEDEDDDEDDETEEEQSSSNENVKSEKILLSNQKEKIVLNGPSNGEEQQTNEVKKSSFISKQEKLRSGVVYSFLVFAVVLIVLLSLKKIN